MKRFFVYLKTELKLSLRDMNMPIFAVIMPLIVFVILGIIYGTKPAYDGASYTFLEQTFGAAAAIAICAGGLMGLPQAVSGLRELKILKRLRVTPAGPVFILGVELSIGMLVGGTAKDAKQASVLASILYFPMLIFSGTTLPIEVMPAAMQKIVGVFPLTQGITMMKQAFLGISAGSVLLPVCVMLGVSALCTALSIRFFRWE